MDKKNLRLSVRPAFICLLLAGVTFTVFSPVVGCDFVYLDDDVYVTHNARVLAGLSWDSVGWVFEHFAAGFWHPLTWLSYMSDVSLFGTSPAGFHFTNLLLHAANAVLLFLALRQMTGTTWRSAMVAALFALHPLHVESVAWISDRKDVLSTLFWMLTLWMYAIYALKAKAIEKDAETKSNFSVQYFKSGYYWLALFFFTLGLMSKPMLVTLPLVLLLMDHWPLRRAKFSNAGKLFFEKMPFLVLAFVAGLLTIFAEKSFGSLSFGTNVPMPVRVSNAILSCARYLSQTFWPVDMAVFYPYPKMFAMWVVAGAALLMVAISMLAIWTRKRQPWFLTGWIWFLVTLLPVSGLIQVGAHARADRYTYVPLIGIFILVVWGAQELASRWRLPKSILAAAALLAIAACAVRAENQLNFWRNSETLFRHALEVTQDNSVVHYNFGKYLADEGRTDEAMEQYRQTIQINPNHAEALNNLGNDLIRIKQYSEAIACLQTATHASPEFAEAHNNLGVALAASGRLDEAIKQYRMAVQLSPDIGAFHNNLAVALRRNGQLDKAVAQYRIAVESDPNPAEAHNNFGIILAQMGRLDDAIKQYQLALQDDPNLAEVHDNFGIALARLGRLDEAITEYQLALQLDPAHATAHNNLGAALFQKGDLDGAAGQFRAAIKYKPDNAVGHRNLGKILALQGKLDEAVQEDMEALRLSPGDKVAKEQLLELSVTVP